MLEPKNSMEMRDAAIGQVRTNQMMNPNSAAILSQPKKKKTHKGVASVDPLEARARAKSTRGALRFRQSIGDDLTENSRRRCEPIREEDAEKWREPSGERRG